VATSSELSDRLAEQERVVALARSAAAEIEAPAALRTRIDAQRGASRRIPTRRFALIATPAAAAALAVGLGLGMFRAGTPGERLQAALAPNGLAPGARGEATLTKTSSGWRIELDATGLPPLAGGSFYEAWPRNPAGVLVPVGTFNDTRKVTLWAGVSPKEFTTLTVTRERADGDQHSSGDKVLTGAVGSGDSG
jgi:hypothetical protein